MTADADAPGYVEIDDPHVVRAIQYAQAVAGGELAACTLTVAACRRQLDDLERWASEPAYPFRFDVELAGKVCRFLELLPHVKGPKANRRELIVLEPWQCFIVTILYGWVEKRGERAGKRRFRRAYIEVARGNAKSTILAGLLLYSMLEGEEGAECVSAATKAEQAAIVFGIAQAMLRKRPDLRGRLGFRDTMHRLVHRRSGAVAFPLSRDSKTQDGLNIHFASIDELHAHKTRETYDVVETGTGKRDNSLLVVITTAGTDTSGICYEIRSYCVQVLEGRESDDSQFAVIYTLDDDDDWTDPGAWRKANPNWNVSVQPEIVEQLAKKAMAVASAQNNFKTKHLNVWCNAHHAWMNMVAWGACADPALKIEEFQGEPCFEALDIANTTDICARAILFWRDLPHRNEGKQAAGEIERHWYAFVFHYLPEDAVTNGKNASYQGWAKDGIIKTTPGKALDLDVVRDDMVEDRDRFEIREIPYDPYQARKLVGECLKLELPMVEYRMTTPNMSPPMKELEHLVLDGRFHHTGDKCLAWQVSNLVCKTDAKDNVYPRKMRQELKIDGGVALIMALGRAVVYESEPDPYTSGRGFRTLSA